MRNALTIAGGALSALQGSIQDPDAHSQTARLVALAARDADYTVTLTAPLNVGVQNMYAGHSSHRSHSSHSSHSSHYSGSGGSYRAPAAPAPYTPPPPTPNLYQPSTSPSTFPPRTSSSSEAYVTRPRATADQLQLMIMRVQAALYAKGYDPGAIDGTLGSATKMALRSFQAAHGLSATGTLTTETLNALGVALTP